MTTPFSGFPDISISTERLVLRPLDEGDVQAFTEMMNDELVTAWTTVPTPYTEQDARALIRREAPALRDRGQGVVLAVAEFLTQRLVGVVQMHDADWRVRSAVLSYAIAPWARGEGYASEALFAMAQWMFHDQKFERLELRTAADNTAAQQVAQKIGCISEGVLRGAYIARSKSEDGAWVDVRTDLIVWSLLPEDLEGVPEHLADHGGFSTYSDWS